MTYSLIFRVFADSLAFSYYNPFDLYEYSVEYKSGVSTMW